MDTTAGPAATLAEKATPSAAAVRRNRSTARARESRRRKKDGLRQITVELFEREIDEFAQHGLLAAHARADKVAISHALYALIEAALEALKAGTLAIKSAKN